MTNKNQPSVQETNKSYRESGMHPFYNKEPKQKTFKFLKLYTELRQHYKLLERGNEEGFNKMDVDIFVDKILKARYLVEDYILPDQEYDHLESDAVKDLKQHILKWRGQSAENLEVNDLRLSQEKSDLMEYANKAKRLETLFMGDYIENGLVKI